jgi:putative transposase
MATNRQQTGNILPLGTQIRWFGDGGKSKFYKSLSSRKCSPCAPAATEAEAERALRAFEQKWDRKYPSISKSWRAHWPELITFLKYPAEIRKAIYTTNAIESLNRSLRKISKNRGVFPNPPSLLKLYYLALERIAKKWTMPIRNWPEALNRFALEFGDRMPPLN